MRSAPLTPYRRIASSIALVAVLSLVGIPATAAAHHHGSESSLTENGSHPSGAEEASECSLCIALSMSDGKALEGHSPPTLDALALTRPSGAFRALAPPAKPSRGLSIRGPPANT